LISKTSIENLKKQLELIKIDPSQSFTQKANATKEFTIIEQRLKAGQLIKYFKLKNF